jgi:hypothetical protein
MVAEPPRKPSSVEQDAAFLDRLKEAADASTSPIKRPSIRNLVREAVGAVMRRRAAETRRTERLTR